LNAVGLDGAAEQLPGSEDVRLASEFTEVARAHPRGEGLVAGRRVIRGRFRFWRGGFGKQVVARHGGTITIFS
jgi:hypothetical protein